MSQLKGEKWNKQLKASDAKGKETPGNKIHGKKTGLGETFSERKGKPNTGKIKSVFSKDSHAAAAGGGCREDKGPFCPASKKCGGCEYQGISYEEQLHRKQKMVESLLKGICRVHPIIGMKDPFHYRNKVHAVFDRKKDGTVISGVYEKNSHRVVPIDGCLIEDEQADAIIRDIRGLLKSFKIRIYDEDTGYGLLRHVLIRRGFTSGEVLVVLVLSSPILPSKNNFVKALRELHPEITTVVLNVNDKKTSMVLGEREITLYGKGYIEDTLCGKVFRISPRSFYQVNPVQTEVLYGKAIELAGLTGKERVIDAYCGIGTIGLTASSLASEVIGVELSKEAVRDAIANAKRNDVKNIRFYQNDAGEFMTGMAEQGEHADVVFMDPPRAGSDEAFLSSVLRLAPKKIVYISCNPETLARDLKYLARGGYRAEGAWPVDMFPWTGHVEVCVELQRKQ
ncbi:23S rRNA (uracil(1939)-C(5))-methyltransferase RlmD [Qiania dongpingensis]|uniref:23S rRNA (Uracil(1939)-C(5))-methyltransferase RlmD n=1 Tax=Qiania dongpingensis TaxID=2763669 RepID=A0A7G9G6A1_9FIRM|nr:23S rRNA (uracil(1939)-C(5))-methyltransferase RlmD [Qiania dongpingensis]QNM06333.1 23S rRNA (uracil(1939)-C(5))-methyltransferase RlmD [Qiania dongpingensis]